MTNRLTPWISDSLPNFVAAENPRFKQFIEAYYDYLELQNVNPHATNSNLHTNLPNPGGVVNQIPDFRDVDLTPESLFQFFENEFIPFAVSNSSIDRNILVKKIRDVYLSKGTRKSYQLFFRLLFQEEIDIFEPRDNILELSAGKYVSFPTATFEVVNFVDRFVDLDFTLASVLQDVDADGDLDIIANTLSATLIGGTANRPIISVQLDRNVENFLDSLILISNSLFIRDVTNSEVFIEVIPQRALGEFTIQNGGSGYTVGENIRFRSRTSNRNFAATIETVQTGTVEGLFVRDRGEYYKVGDRIVFEAENIAQGQGGEAIITEIDRHGRILSIDGNRVRSGELNEGYPADTFEDVLVSVNIGGSYRELPNAKFELIEREEGEPLGRGAVVTPYSRSIGSIQEIGLRERGFFSDDLDIDIEIPMSVNLEDTTEFVTGEVVAFQKFKPSHEAFEADSEVIELTWTFDSDAYSSDSDSDFAFKLPVGFFFEEQDLIDPEKTFNWITVDSTTSRIRNGNELKQLFDSERIALNGFSDSDIIEVVARDSEFKIRIDSKRISGLDYYHFNKLNVSDISQISNSPHITFSWRVVPSDPKPGTTDLIGQWENTGYYGTIGTISTNRKSVTVNSIRTRPFPSDSDLDSETLPRFSILRIASANLSTGDITIREGLASANIISSYHTANLVPVLTTSTNTSVRTFVDESGFLNSSSGGVIQDGLFYSTFSYVIQSDLQMSDWRVPVRTTLHPAGTQLYGEYNINVNTSPGATQQVVTDFNGRFSKFTYDAENDVHDPTTNLSPLNASNAYYDANAYNVYLRSAPDGVVFTADNYINDSLRTEQLEQGNSWWDYEPIGLVTKQVIVYDSEELDTAVSQLIEDNVMWDSDTEIRYDREEIIERFLKRRVTTQDSDGNGYVGQQEKYFAMFDGTFQDLYKNGRRGRYFQEEYVIKPAVRRTATVFDVSNRPSDLIEIIEKLTDLGREDEIPTVLFWWRNNLTAEELLVGGGPLRTFYPIRDVGLETIDKPWTTEFTGPGDMSIINEDWWDRFNGDLTYRQGKTIIWIPGCGFMTSEPITNLDRAFSGITAPSINIQEWDTSTVTSMRSTFRDAVYNLPLMTSSRVRDEGDSDLEYRYNSWDVSRVTIMDTMFYNNVGFNQDIHNWDTSSVTNMAGMFQGAVMFDQNINTVIDVVDGNEVEYWNVSNVTAMNNMFAAIIRNDIDADLLDSDSVGLLTDSDIVGTMAFNGSVRNWDVRQVTTTNSMFFFATEFNQYLGEWELDNVEDTTNMFLGARSFNNGE